MNQLSESAQPKSHKTHRHKMDETKLHMCLLVGAYIYTILWITLFLLGQSQSPTDYPSSLLHYLTKSSIPIDDVYLSIDEYGVLTPVNAGIQQEKQILILNEYNFTRFFEIYNYAPVDFSSKSCKNGFRLSPADSDRYGSAVLVKKSGIGMFSSIDLSAYVVNRKFDCSLEGSRDTIVSWMKMQMMKKERLRKSVNLERDVKGA